LTPKIGDRVRRRISYGMNGGSFLPPETGTVVYVHPEGRFYSVEYTFEGRDGHVRKFRESYITEDRQGTSDVPFTRGPSLPDGSDFRR
jgi:hypothetical protein